MKHLFLEHPASVGESYWQHMGQAMRFGTLLCLTGLACLFHGLLPFLFKDTGSKNITRLHEMMVTHRHRHHNSENADALIKAEPLT